MSYQPDPKFFNWGQDFQQGIQQSQDSKRRNALLDLEQRQFGLQEQRVGLEQKRYDQAEQERQSAMQAQAKKEGIGLKALAASRGDKQSGMAVLQELGLPVEFADDPDAGEMYQAIAEQYGGFSAPQQQSLGQLYQVEGPQGPQYVTGQQALGQTPYRAPVQGPQPPAPSYTEIVDPTNPKQMLRIDGRIYRGGGLGSPGVIGISGKEPSAAKADETRGTGKSSVTDIVTTLRDAYGQLHKGGGIVDPKAGAIENIGNRVQSSSVGQFVGGAVGTRNQSLRNQIKQSRPLLLQAIRQATGMTGKQMDSNVELQLYLSAATDPELDIAANMEALDNLDRLYGLGLDGDAPKPIQNAPAGTTLRFDANGDPIQ